MLLDAICPDEALREASLRAISETISVAHEANEAGWSISLRDNNRSNVVSGRVWVLGFNSDRLYITLVPSELSDEARQLLDERAIDRGIFEFASVPSATCYSVPLDVVGDAWPLVREAHFSAVREAAQGVRRTPSYRAFSAELLDEIETELDRDLPRPKYGGGELTPQAVDRLLALVRACYPGWEGFRDDRFVDEEITYKKKLIELAQEQLSKDALTALIEAGDFKAVIDRLDKIGKKENLLFRGVPRAGDLNILYQEDLDKEAFCVAILDLLYGPGDGAERLARYLDWLLSVGTPRKANKWTFPTYFLFLLHPSDEMFLKPSVVRELAKIAELDLALGARPTADTYAAVREAYSQIGELLVDYSPTDMVDLQSFVYAAVRAQREGLTETTTWWVNQGQSYSAERSGNFIWAGQRDSGGRRLSHHEALKQLSPGHRILHYANGSLRGVGTVTGELEERTKPNSEGTELEGMLGYYVAVDYQDLSTPIELAQIPEDLRVAERGPFNAEGRVNQGYLFPISTDFEEALAARFSTLNDLTGPAVPTRGYWVFQANPKAYDLSRAAKRRSEMTWLVRQHADEIVEGDQVFLWQSGPNAALMATCRVASPVGEMKQVPEDDDCLLSDEEKFDGVQLRVLLDSVEPIEPPIARARLLEVPDLSDAAVFTGWQGTNYRITSEQATLLDDEIRRPSTRALGLVQRLEAEGYHFPEELLANYLLALQTKRFVILTGISGTGKTQLALQVARHFQPTISRRSPVSVPDDALELEAYPYMLKYSGMVLPKAFVTTIEFPDSANSVKGRIPVSYPGGRIELSFGVDQERNVTHLSFRGAFREWFQGSLRPGDPFLLRRLETADGDSDELEFTLPATEEVETQLDNYRVIAVRPDWTDNRGLLGFLNPLTGQYTRTEFLDLLLRARDEEDRAREEGRLPAPHFAILDEMNLARVEQYFSDFLSALESGEPLDLHNDDGVAAGEGETLLPVPKRVRLPGNVFFTGTVNVDETTYMFSPKVLDRAFTLELNEVDLEAYGGLTAGAVVTDRLSVSDVAQVLRPYRKPGKDDWDQFGDVGDSALREMLVELNRVLSFENHHFGYRVANEIARFVNLVADRAETDETVWAALDIAVLQKVLPKFNGTQQELEAVLRKLFRFAVGSDPTPDDLNEPTELEWTVTDGQISYLEQEAGDEAEPVLPRTAAKLWRMLQRLRRQGFTSFIE